MPTVRYTVANGRVIAEKRDGVRKLYVPDALGSTVALIDSTQTVTDTFSYWPYGEEASRTGTTPTPFRYGGTQGYYRNSASKTYVRARVLDTEKGRWLTQDPIGLAGGDINLYRYVLNNSVTMLDASGLIPRAEKGCAEKADVDKAIGMVCNRLKNFPKGCLSQSEQDCLKKLCSENMTIKCGSPRCTSPGGTQQKLCAYTNTFLGSCDITLCTHRIGKLSECGRPPGPWNPLVWIAAVILHEMLHCCGVGDAGKVNPAERKARCCFRLPGDIPGYDNNDWW